MTSLQLDVCDHNQWWRHLVNAYEVEGIWVEKWPLIEIRRTNAESLHWLTKEYAKVAIPVHVKWSSLEIQRGQHSEVLVVAITVARFLVLPAGEYCFEQLHAVWEGYLCVCGTQSFTYITFAAYSLAVPRTADFLVTGRHACAKRSHAGIVLLSGPKIGFSPRRGDTLPR